MERCKISAVLHDLSRGFNRLDRGPGAERSRVKRNCQLEEGRMVTWTIPALGPSAGGSRQPPTLDSLWCSYWLSDPVRLSASASLPPLRLCMKADQAAPLIA